MKKRKILSIAMSSILALGISSSALAESHKERVNGAVFYDKVTPGLGRLTGRYMTTEEIKAIKAKEAEELRVEEQEQSNQNNSAAKERFKATPELLKRLSEQDREDYEGVLSNGLRYKVHHMTLEEIEAYENGRAQTLSYSWTGNVRVPKSNAAGTNGAQVGHDFVIAPHNLADFIIGSLPTAMPRVNVGVSATNGMDSDWIPDVGEYMTVTFFPRSGAEYYSYQFRVSTNEASSSIARFSIETR